MKIAVDPKDIILLIMYVMERNGLQCNRIRLHKTAYILQEYLNGDIMGYRFIFTPYYFGPFSMTIGDNLLQLADSNMVKMKSDDYYLTEKGRDKAKRLASTFEDLFWKIDQLLFQLNFRCAFEDDESFGRFMRVIYVLKLHGTIVDEESYKKVFCDLFPWDDEGEEASKSFNRYRDILPLFMGPKEVNYGVWFYGG